MNLRLINNLRPDPKKETKFNSLTVKIMIRSKAQIEIEMILQDSVMANPNLASGHQEFNINPKMEATI